MSTFKRILIFGLIFVLLALNFIAIGYAFTANENSGAIIVICIATTCVLSVFIKFIIMFLKRKKD